MLQDAVTRRPGVRAFEQAGWIFAALLPAALTLYLGFNSGGFFPGAAALAAAELAVVVAIRLAVSRRPYEGLSLPLGLAAVALGGFAAWTLASAGWSDSTARALPEYTRALLYALTLVFFGLLPFDARRIRWMLYGLAAAVVAICVTAVIARTLPQVILDPALADEDRLGYPLTYWNALGLVAGLGIVLCGHLSCSAKDPWPARVLGAAAVPLLTLTLYYTLSRGATWATAGAVVVYLLVGRPRALISGAVATAPTTLIALVVANPPNALTDGNPAGPAAIAAGEHVATVLAACMLGAALLRAALLPLDRWMGSLRLPSGARRPVLAGAAASVAAIVVAGGIVLHAPAVVAAKYEQFTDQADGSVGGGGSRLLSASPNGRQEHWEVALAAFRRDRLRGSGAGTYSLLWAKERSGSVRVQDAHSLYVEVLGELGLVGFVLLVVALALILGAFAYRARGPDRAMFAALLAAGLGWAAASGVDWDWEMPVTAVWLFAFGGAALARAPRDQETTGSRLWQPAARVAGIAACLVLAMTPIRVAIAADRFDSALGDFRNGDCRQAKAEAREALAAVEQRIGPYELIAFCEMRQGRYRSAVAATKAARQRDPRNWEIHYSLAVARAAAGLDPRAAANRAAALNPNDPRASGAPALFGGSSRRAWIAAGRSAALLPPSSADP